MNLIGKIFTVLILVMSLFFCAFAVAVYATHKNWKTVVDNPEDKATLETPLGLMQELEKAKTRNQQLKDEKLKLENGLAAEKEAKKQAVTKLDNEKQALEDELLTARNDLKDLRLSESKAVDAMNLAHVALAKKRDEITDLRDKIAQAHQDRDAYFKTVVQLTDERNQAHNELERLKERQLTLDEHLAKAEAVLRHIGVSKDTPITDTPPLVDGLVRAVNSDGLVEISIGSDDGLLKGHKLEVVRRAGGRSTYVGRIEVAQTYPDRAVCTIDRKFLQSHVRTDDFVTTRLQ